MGSSKNISMECKHLHIVLFITFLFFYTQLTILIATWYYSRPGGDKIYSVFDNQLPAALKRLQFDKHLALDNVRKLITEADGYQPHLIAPEQGYRRLIETALITIKGPAEAVVDAVNTSFSPLPSFLSFFLSLYRYTIKSCCCFQVHGILKELVHKSINETAVSQKSRCRITLACTLVNVDQILVLHTNL